uniref:Uncharacterized protein n=1 Tax=Arundo donax TaxID=35708 RepID=A0A0A9C5W4_ARUDO
MLMAPASRASLCMPADMTSASI